METKLTRRHLQRAALGVPAPLALALLTGRGAGITFAQSTQVPATPPVEATPILAPTSACDDRDDDDLDTTLAQTEGPYFTPNSPERASLLEDGMPGTKLVVTGYVYSTDCKPIAEALFESWQCDDVGEYDNVGYTLRGHQFTDKEGRFELTTIVPGIYPGRTRHIHVKVQAPNGPILTSQLYFPDEEQNGSDGIFDPSLVVDMEVADQAQLAFFNFVLEPVE